MDVWLDYDGEPCTMERWCELWADLEGRRVALTRMGDVEVSTVWLGVDQGFGAVPLIYESLIRGGVFDGVIERYTNRVAALAGHDQLVEYARDAALHKIAADIATEFGFKEDA